jgi:hypothetical protein
MATEAQIEANRRNSKWSTGPRTDQGKNRSRFNALVHGCRASVLVLPTEDFGRTLLRMFELLLKVRRTGEVLDLGTIATIGRSLPSGNVGPIDRLAPAVATAITPPVEPVHEPDPPVEANPIRQSAPNEPNFDVQAPRTTLRGGHKEFGIDTPHLGRKADEFGITGNDAIHPALRRLLTGPGPTLLDILVSRP